MSAQVDTNCCTISKDNENFWDTTKVIKNQDYHDGLVKGLKMASKLVAKL